MTKLIVTSQNFANALKMGSLKTLDWRKPAARQHGQWQYNCNDALEIPELVTIKGKIVFSIYCGVIKSRRIRLAEHVTKMEEGRGVYGVLVGKPEENRPLGRPRRGWEDNIKMDLQEVGYGAWTGLNWLRIEIGGGHL
jgi:hypothetical protein